MRLYNANTCTPAVTSSGTRSCFQRSEPRIQSLAVKVNNKPPPTTTQLDTQSLKLEAPTQRKVKEKFQSPIPSSHDEYHITRNPPHFLSRNTTADTSVSSGTFCGIFNRNSSRSFHFDVDGATCNDLDERCRGASSPFPSDFSASTLTTVSAFETYQDLLEKGHPPYQPIESAVSSSVEKSRLGQELIWPSPCRVRPRPRLSDVEPKDFGIEEIENVAARSKPNPDHKTPSQWKLHENCAFLPKNLAASVPEPKRTQSKKWNTFGASRRSNVDANNDMPDPQCLTPLTWVPFVTRFESSPASIEDSISTLFEPIEFPKDAPSKSMIVASPKPKGYFSKDRGRGVSGRDSFKGHPQKLHASDADSQTLEKAEDGILSLERIGGKVFQRIPGLSKCAKMTTPQIYSNRKYIAASSGYSETTGTFSVLDEQLHSPDLGAASLEQIFQKERLRKFQTNGKEMKQFKGKVDVEQKHSEIVVNLENQPTNYAHKSAFSATKKAVKAVPSSDDLEKANMLDLTNKGPSDKMIPDLPEKYTKMLKVGLSRAATENSMRRDGIDPDDFRPPETTSSKLLPTVAAKDPFRRFRIHWEAHTNVRSNTVWAMIGRDDQWLLNLAIDHDEMFTLFSETRDSAPHTRKPGQRKNNANAVKVIDSKRAKNGGIILARIRMSYKEIVRAIDSMDETALTLEQIKGIGFLVPTLEEREALKRHIERSGEELTTECEKFMSEIISVEDPARNLEAMLFMKKFPFCVLELKNGKKDEVKGHRWQPRLLNVSSRFTDAKTIQKVCDEILGASKLRRVLGVILRLGNELNQADVAAPKGAVDAVTVKSLSKLNQDKAFDRKMTFLQYAAQIIRENNEELLLFKDDMPSLKLAEKISWEESMQNVESIENSLTRLRKIALGRAQDDSAEKERGELPTENEFRVLQRTSIGRFIFNSYVEINSMYKEIEAAKSAFESLLNYFGEEATEPEVQHFLHFLFEFCNDFENAAERAVDKGNHYAKSERR
jgi:hypothetical protein